MTPVDSEGNTWLMMKPFRKEGSPEMGDRERGDRVGASGGKSTISPNSSRVRINQGHQVPMPLWRIEQQEDGYFSTAASLKAPRRPAA